MLKQGDLAYITSDRFWYSVEDHETKVLYKKGTVVLVTEVTEGYIREVKILKDGLNIPLYLSPSNSFFTKL